jgi:hypothetical protein
VRAWQSADVFGHRIDGNIYLIPESASSYRVRFGPPALSRATGGTECVFCVRRRPGSLDARAYVLDAQYVVPL